MIRALLDTNLFISFLLSPRREALAIGAILAAAVAGRFTLLFTPGLATEIRSTVSNRSDLAAKIAPERLGQLMALVEAIAEPIPALGPEIPVIGRDPKDDYLIVHAVLARADYLVSWDFDLRDIGSLGGVAVVSPPEFLAVLRTAGLL